MTAGQSARPLAQTRPTGRIAAAVAIVASVVIAVAIVAAIYLSAHAAVSTGTSTVPVNAAAPAVHLPNGLLPASVPDTRIAHPARPQ